MILSLESIAVAFVALLGALGAAWITATVPSLSRRVDALEAEVRALKGKGRRR